MRKDNFVGGRNQDNGWIGCAAVAVVLFILAAIGILMMLTGCSPKNFPPAQETTTEHTSVDTHDTIDLRDTTIYVPIPLEGWQVVASVRDTARAETSVAEAKSFLDSLGLIHLDLRNKPTKLEAVVSIPHRTIWINTSTEKEHIKQVPVFVEKPLSWWQSFKIGAFWWLCGAVVPLLLWTFRKLIFKL